MPKAQQSSDNALDARAIITIETDCCMNNLLSPRVSSQRLVEVASIERRKKLSSARDQESRAAMNKAGSKVENLHTVSLARSLSTGADASGTKGVGLAMIAACPPLFTFSRSSSILSWSSAFCFEVSPPTDPHDVLS